MIDPAILLSLAGEAPLPANFRRENPANSVDVPKRRFHDSE